MSSSVIVPSWLDDLSSEVAPSLLESEDADSLDPVSVDCTVGARDRLGGEVIGHRAVPDGVDRLERAIDRDTVEGVAHGTA